jgi:hypothetical protein
LPELRNLYEMSLRDIAGHLVIATGEKKGQHPSPATVMRMLRQHDEKTAAAVAADQHAPVPRFEFQANAVSSHYFAARRAIGVLGHLGGAADRLASRRDRSRSSPDTALPPLSRGCG